MQKKTIKAILNKKFKDFVQSIDDNDVKKLVKQNTIITGGCIASMLLKEQVKDYDLYFRNMETALAVSNYYAKKFMENNGKNKHVIVCLGRSPVNKQYLLEHGCDEHEVNITSGTHGGTVYNAEPNRIRLLIKSYGVAYDEDTMEEDITEEPFEDVFDVIESTVNTFVDTEDASEIVNEVEKSTSNYKPIFISPNAITLSNKVQLVIRFYGEPEEIHKNYDFVHATNYWTSWNNEIVLKLEALESLMAKQLYYIGSKYPVCSIIRTRKFINRGWHINAGQYLKMIFQCNELNLHDIDVLEDQLIGVDSAYFTQLLTSVRKKINNNEIAEVDFGYLCDIIDKIF